MPQLLPVAQQLAEARQIVRRRDDEDLADPRQHQRRQRVVDHRLVVDRQELLRHHRGERVEPRAAAAGEDDPFHGSNHSQKGPRVQAARLDFQPTIEFPPRLNARSLGDAGGGSRGDHPPRTVPARPDPERGRSALRRRCRRDVRGPAALPRMGREQTARHLLPLPGRLRGRRPLPHGSGPRAHHPLGPRHRPRPRAPRRAARRPPGRPFLLRLHHGPGALGPRDPVRAPLLAAARARCPPPHRRTRRPGRPGWPGRRARRPPARPSARRRRPHRHRHGNQAHRRLSPRRGRPLAPPSPPTAGME